MGERAGLIRGWVRNGVVVPEPGTTLPEGTEVRIAVAPPGPIPLTPDEQAEFDAWDRAGDQAWAAIDWGEGEIARDAG